jgi:predicted negative regulator of RcsB-dependent stress response
VDTFRTEEEQVEALRRWWDDNGRSTLFAIIVAVGAGFGWQGWQQQQLQEAESASITYQELLEATGQEPGESQRATIQHLAQELKSNHAGSTYAQFASLHLARLAVVEGELETAEQELRAVLTMNPPDEVRMLAELRLARVVAAGGDPEAGMEILAAAKAGAYEPAYAEARGDMHMQLGQENLARVAYQSAAELAAAAGSGASASLQLKLQTLLPVPARQSQAVIPAESVLSEEPELDAEE